MKLIVAHFRHAFHGLVNTPARGYDLKLVDQGLEAACQMNTPARGYDLKLWEHINASGAKQNTPARGYDLKLGNGHTVPIYDIENTPARGYDLKQP